MKKSKLVAILMAASVFMAFALGSGSSDSSNSGKEITSATDSSGTEISSTTDDSATTETKVDTLTPTIEEAVIFEDKGIKITAKEYYTDSFWGDGIKFLIENDTDKNITVGTNAVIVNNYMISDLFVAEVAAGKKSNETLNLMSSQLKAAGIETIGQIEVDFHIYDSDTWGDIVNTDVVTIKTSLYDKMDTTVDDAGQLLYEEGGVKIVGKFVNESDFWGTAVMLYVENKSGRNVTIQADNLSVNGFTMGSALFSCTVYDG